jgi:signal transduction histidine kinase
MLLVAISTNASVVSAEDAANLAYNPESILFIADPAHNLTIEEVQRIDQWQLWQDKNILNFGMTQSVYWIKLELHNLAAEQYLRLKSPLVDYIDIYFIQQDQIDHRQSGAAYPFSQREVQALDYLFKIPQGKLTAYIRLRSNFALQVPLEIASLEHFNRSSTQQYWGLGLYFGLMLAMVFYNLFIYFSIRDKAYISYILYTIFLALTYASFMGIAFQHLWPDNPKFNNLIPAFSSICTIFLILFVIDFLGIKKGNLPRIYWICLICVVIFAACSLANIFGDYYTSASASQLTTTVVSFYLLFVGAITYRQGIKTARFFLLGWSLFLVTVVIYVLTLQGVIAYTAFTSNSVLYGSALEVILFSIALADKINILKDEKEASQQQALQALEENQRIVQEQNIILESRVQERTRELDQSNHTLKQTLEELKLTQSKVVETEKMASLGQLTAGIAHEINNPLTFIKANIKPLKRNLITLQEVIDRCGAVVTETQWRQQSETIANFKQEIEYDYIREETQLLLQGIEEGANRTVTIVEGLKSFSRLGSGDFQLYALESGIESTLTLLTHQIRDHGITIHRDYGNNIQANCLPDRINQVFMNILSNAIDALEEKNGGNPEISIVLSADQDWVTVEISDNGVGIDEAAMNKLFDPFFTTKEVGSGTGLGLSIVYGIIQDHTGTITVDSIPNKNTVFTLKLPV